MRPTSPSGWRTVVSTDAGYSYDGGKLKDKDGRPVAFTLTDSAGWSDYLTALQLISDAVGRLGITATIATPNQDSWSHSIAVGDFQAALHWTSSGNTPWQMYSNMFDDVYQQPSGEVASWNSGRYQNPASSQAFTDYTKATDDASRRAALHQLQQIYVDDVPAIGIDNRPSLGLYTTKNRIG